MNQAMIMDTQLTERNDSRTFRMLQRFLQSGMKSKPSKNELHVNLAVVQSNQVIYQGDMMSQCLGFGSCGVMAQRVPRWLIWLKQWRSRS